MSDLLVSRARCQPSYTRMAVGVEAVCRWPGLATLIVSPAPEIGKEKNNLLYFH